MRAELSEVTKLSISELNSGLILRIRNTIRQLFETVQ